jgi:hypothetical protein
MKQIKNYLVYSMLVLFFALAFSCNDDDVEPMEPPCEDTAAVLNTVVSRQGIAGVDLTGNVTIYFRNLSLSQLGGEFYVDQEWFDTFDRFRTDDHDFDYHIWRVDIDHYLNKKRYAKIEARYNVCDKDTIVSLQMFFTLRDNAQLDRGSGYSVEINEVLRNGEPVDMPIGSEDHGSDYFYIPSKGKFDLYGTQ